MDDIFKIVKLLEDLEVLIDWLTKAGKHEGGFCGASVVQPVISSVVKGIAGRGVMRAGRGCYSNMGINS